MLRNVFYANIVFEMVGHPTAEPEWALSGGRSNFIGRFNYFLNR